MAKSAKIQIFTPSQFLDHELIDAGGGEKLERFGKFVLIKPEPQALWAASLSPEEWRKMAHARFVQDGSASGDWERYDSALPDQWTIGYTHGDMKLRFRLGLTRFKHVGVFPEQAVNWDFIHDRCKALKAPKVLNLFAYTGGASLAAKAGGADVIHCDAIKQVVNWAAANMELSKLDGIRWLVEDAFKFVQREAKRGNQYDGIILDPPAWGHGPKGEKWKLEDQINELMQQVAAILAPEKSLPGDERVFARLLLPDPGKPGPQPFQRSATEEPRNRRALPHRTQRQKAARRGIHAVLELIQDCTSECQATLIRIFP